MNTVKNKWLLWAVIILIIANVALLATIWLFHHRQTRHVSPAEFLVKELKFDDKQKDQLHQLANEHHRQAEKIQMQIRDARDSFFQMLKQPEINDSAKKIMSANIAAKLQELDLLTFDHFKQVRSICSPDQQKKFDEIIQNVLQMMAPPNEHDAMHRPPPPNDTPPPDL